MDEILPAIIERVKAWSDLCVVLFGGNIGLAYLSIQFWRRWAETRSALQESQMAHAADLREQIKLSQEHTDYFQRFAEGFREGTNRLRPFANKETQHK